MKKTKVVLNYIHYPVAIARYFHEAFLRMDDCEVVSVGPFTGAWIPWNGGMTINPKYVLSPDVPLPQSYIGNIHTPSQIAVSQIGDADLWVNIDAGYNMLRPQISGKVVNVFTDPHVLSQNYAQVRDRVDVNFNMQKVYSQPGDIYLPYCADPIYHAPLEREKEYDVCLIGLQYGNRVSLSNRLRAEGLRVFSEIGIVYHEYQEKYAQSKVAFSWSSMDDLIARVFEAGMMKIPLVANQVTDMSEFFDAGVDYLPFNDITQAVEKIMWALANYAEASEMAKKMHIKVKENHTYDRRVEQILGVL